MEIQMMIKLLWRQKMVWFFQQTKLLYQFHLVIILFVSLLSRHKVRDKIILRLFEETFWSFVRTISPPWEPWHCPSNKRFEDWHNRQNFSGVWEAILESKGAWISIFMVWRCPKWERQSSQLDKATERIWWCIAATEHAWRIHGWSSCKVSSLQFIKIFSGQIFDYIDQSFQSHGRFIRQRNFWSSPQSANSILEKVRGQP